MSFLGDQFRQQRKYLENSSKLFDEGDTPEAIRLAVSLRVFLHDTGASHSILHQANLKSTMNFIDSAVIGGTEIFMGAVVVQLEYVAVDGTTGFAPSGQDGVVEVVPAPRGHGRIQAPLRRRGHETLKPFDSWWNDKVMDSAAGPKQFSRSDLVKIMANKGGGAHVDPTGPPDDYLGFVSVGQGQSWSANAADALDPTFTDMQPFEGNAAAESIRQVTWELLETLDTDQVVLAWLEFN